MMIAPTIQQTRCKHWISRHSPSDGSVVVSDVTSAYTAICIMGPATRPLLSKLTDTDLSPKNFPFFTFKVSHQRRIIKQNNKKKKKKKICIANKIHREISFSGIRCWTGQWHSYNELDSHR